MARNGGKRRRKNDDGLVLALARGLSVRDAAVAAGLSERTVSRRTAEAAFQRRVVSARDRLFAESFGRMAGTVNQAIDTLRELLAAESETVRLGAARAVLEYAVKLRETVEVVDRLAAIEERVTAMNHGWPTRGATSFGGQGNNGYATKA